MNVVYLAGAQGFRTGAQATCLGVALGCSWRMTCASIVCVAVWADVGELVTGFVTQVAIWARLVNLRSRRVFVLACLG